ncbi:hypothetical protein ABW19_dt0200743 [Dactylella cylindrospora]|nr:hypothetical protein ABW19_dt0200743 [Dactylella cylindrospora]
MDLTQENVDGADWMRFTSRQSAGRKPVPESQARQTPPDIENSVRQGLSELSDPVSARSSNENSAPIRSGPRKSRNGAGYQTGADSNSLQELEGTPGSIGKAQQGMAKVILNGTDISENPTSAYPSMEDIQPIDFDDDSFSDDGDFISERIAFHQVQALQYWLNKDFEEQEMHLDVLIHQLPGFHVLGAKIDKAISQMMRGQGQEAFELLQDFKYDPSYGHDINMAVYYTRAAASCLSEKFAQALVDCKRGMAFFNKLPTIRQEDKKVIRVRLIGVSYPDGIVFPEWVSILNTSSLIPTPTTPLQLAACLPDARSDIVRDEAEKTRIQIRANEFVKELITHDVPLNTFDKHERYTALSMALFSGNILTAETLLQGGALVNDQGKSPPLSAALQYAGQTGDLRALLLLEKYEPNLLFQSHYLISPLHYAVFVAKYSGVVRYVLAKWPKERLKETQTFRQLGGKDATTPLTPYGLAKKLRKDFIVLTFHRFSIFE